MRTLQGLMLVECFSRFRPLSCRGTSVGREGRNAAVRVSKQIGNAGFRNLGQCVSSATGRRKPPSPTLSWTSGSARYDCRRRIWQSVGDNH